MKNRFAKNKVTAINQLPGYVRKKIGDRITLPPVGEITAVYFDGKLIWPRN